MEEGSASGRGRIDETKEEERKSKEGRKKDREKGKEEERERDQEREREKGEVENRDGMERQPESRNRTFKSLDEEKREGGSVYPSSTPSSLRRKKERSTMMRWLINVTDGSTRLPLSLLLIFLSLCGLRDTSQAPSSSSFSSSCMQEEGAGCKEQFTECIYSWNGLKRCGGHLRKSRSEKKKKRKGKRVDNQEIRLPPTYYRVYIHLLPTGTSYST